MRPVQEENLLDVIEIKAALAEVFDDEERIEEQLKLFLANFLDDHADIDYWVENVELLNKETIEKLREVMTAEMQKAIAVKVAEQKMEILKNYDGLEMEIKGTWLWITGNTQAHKEALKMVKCFCIGNKKNGRSESKFYWGFKSAIVPSRSGAPKSMSYINRRYGTQVRVVGADPRPDDEE